MVKIKSEPKSTTRTYYQVGGKEPTTHPYSCTRNSKELDKRQSICEHDFLKVFSDARSIEEAKRIRADLVSQPFVLQIMASDMGGLEHNLACASEGSTHFWCWKCGYYLDVLGRHVLLPKCGRAILD